MTICYAPAMTNRYGVDVKPSVRKALRHLRESNGYSQGEVAETLGVTQATVSHWESGRRTPSVNDLAALASVYRVEPSTFMPSLDEIERARKFVREES